jgi:predicted RNase H-like nuclease (RuvC/YqgF family)
VKDAKAEDLEALKTKLEKEIADLKKDIKTLQERSKDYYETIYGKTALEEGLPRRVEKMETTLADISKRLKALEEKATSTSGSSPLTGGAVTGPKAKIKLINEYAVKVSIVVNGTSYQLDPKQSKELEINSGSFSYQLLIDNAERVTSAVKEGETVTLRIK